MGCGDSDYKIDIPDFEFPDAVGEGDIFHRPFFFSLCRYFPQSVNSFTIFAPIFNRNNFLAV